MRQGASLGCHLRGRGEALNWDAEFSFTGDLQGGTSMAPHFANTSLSLAMRGIQDRHSHWEEHKTPKCPSNAIYLQARAGLRKNRNLTPALLELLPFLVLSGLTDGEAQLTTGSARWASQGKRHRASCSPCAWRLHPNRPRQQFSFQSCRDG